MTLDAYREVRVLADEGAVRSSLCEDVKSGERVVVRTLSLQAATSHDQGMLFEREGDVLVPLDHPRLPKIIDRYHRTRGYVEGQSLLEELPSGRHLSEGATSAERYDAVTIENQTLQLVHDIVTVEKAFADMAALQGGAAVMRR